MFRLLAIFVFVIVFLSAVKSQEHYAKSYNVYESVEKVINEEKPDSIYIYIWNDTNQYWIRNERFVLSYNLNNDVLNNVRSKWKNNSWVLYDKIAHTYENDKKISKIYYWWDLAYKEWVYEKMYKYTYDTLYNLVGITKSNWTEINFEWENDSLYQYDYDQNGNLSNEIKNIWINVRDSWEPLYRLGYEYDSLDYRISKTGYSYDYDLTHWKALQKWSFVYKSNYDLESEIYQEYINENNLINHWKRVFLYNNGLLKEEIKYKWIENDWLEDYKYEFIFDSLNRIFSKIGYIYDWDLFVWENQFKIEYQYFDDSKLNRVTFYYWDDGNFTWKPEKRFDSFNRGFTNIQTIRPNVNVVVSPNPSYGPVFIENKNNFEISFIEIINQKGTVIYKTVVNKDLITINFNNFNVPNGFYFIRVGIKENTVTKKLIYCNQY